MHYMTIPEAALLWRTTSQNVRYACEVHKIDGAVRFGRSWLIPQSIGRPETIILDEERKFTYLRLNEQSYQLRLRANRGEL